MKEPLQTVLGPLKLKNPVMVASGTFGYGVEYQEILDISKIGAISVKGISLEPRAGNPPPRVCETPSGMLNAIGLANIGFDEFANNTMPRLRDLNATVIVNAYGTSPEEFAELAAKFESVEGVVAIEVNISCPNVKAGGIHFGFRPESAAQITEAVRNATSLPILVKLSPEATDLKGVAQAVEEAGADGISLINTIRGMSIDVDTKRPRLGSVMGGLSGPAIRPIAVRMVYEVYNAVKVPIVGMGGITCLRDALEFFMAGAGAVQVGTANFTNPLTAIEIIEELEKYLQSNNLGIKDLVGQVEIS